jgi:hypothetical protein
MGEKYRKMLATWKKCKMKFKVGDLVRSRLSADFDLGLVLQVGDPRRNRLIKVLWSDGTSSHWYISDLERLQDD